MADRIDHVAVAVASCKRAESARSLKAAEVYALNAQAHATLALVEQQRIANLIALHKHEVPTGRRITDQKSGEYPLLAEIRKGLKL